MTQAVLLMVPVALGCFTAIGLPFSGYRWDAALVWPVALGTILLAIFEVAIGAAIDDVPEIGLGSAIWMGKGGAIAILLANAASILITKRALKRKCLGQPYRF